MKFVCLRNAPSLSPILAPRNETGLKPGDRMNGFASPSSADLLSEK